MRVFITGAAGFIGQATTKELIANGHDVTGLARNDANEEILKKLGAKVLRGSLQDLDSLKKGAKDADGVIHLAFIHDFSTFAENGQVDRRAIEAMGGVLEGTNKPLIVTSGVAMLSPDGYATEDMMRHQEGMPRQSEDAVFGFKDRGVRAMAMRLPQVHGGEGKAGFIGYLFEVARQKKLAAYVGDGGNRWAAAHRLDVARCYRLALEKGVSGKAYHAVADEGVTTRQFADIFAKILKVETRSLTPDQAAEHFGWIAMFAGAGMAASSAKTQAELGWKPKEIGVVEDISKPGYFAA